MEEQKKPTPLNKKDKFPLRQKSTCCSEVLLVSLADMNSLFEDKLGFKVDEAFLEDSALRLLKQSLKRKDCSCATYKHIIMDMDDPTIIIQRFVPQIKEFMKENSVSYELSACSNRDNEKQRSLCSKNDVQFYKKPVTLDNLRHLAK